MFFAVGCFVLKFVLAFGILELTGLEFAGRLGAGLRTDLKWPRLAIVWVPVGRAGFRSLAVNFFSIRIARPFVSGFDLSCDFVSGLWPFS